MSVTSTSSSSLAQTQSATQTGSPVPLVTQFSQPLDCSSLFTVVSVDSTSVWLHTNLTTTFLASDTANSRFSSCQPTGWDRAHFTFSPGLCPSGWKYYNLHAVTTRNVTESQAYCCPRTFQLQDRTPSGDILQCTSASFDDSTHTRFLAHDAWLVKWQPADNLPVSLPGLPSGSTARDWRPGETIAFPSTTTATYVPQSNYGNDLGFGIEYLVVVIVIPIVVFIILVVGCVFGCRYRKKHKRKMQEQLEQRQARAGAAKTETAEVKTAEATTAEVKTNVA